MVARTGHSTSVPAMQCCKDGKELNPGIIAFCQFGFLLLREVDFIRFGYSSRTHRSVARILVNSSKWRCEAPANDVRHRQRRKLPSSASVGIPCLRYRPTKTGTISCFAADITSWAVSNSLWKPSALDTCCKCETTMVIRCCIWPLGTGT
jgi:hypothetical protein